MSRLPQFATLLIAGSMSVCAQQSAPIRGQTGTLAGAATARVQHVVVRGTGDSMEVEIQTSGAPVAPDTQAITGPDRIVVDFPGALPAAELRALKVNRGSLKAVRTGLFFSNPPITRIVLDLAEPQAYQISTIKNAIVVKLGSTSAAKRDSAASEVETVRSAHTPAARLQNAVLATGAKNVISEPRSSRIANTATNGIPDATEPVSPIQEATPPKPAVTVSYENGTLRIRTDKATLAQVLFEVQRQTQAEIAIPAGAEQEEVFADLGPAPFREVLASLLNGSPYNFIFVGTEQHLEQVILTRRDSNPF